MSRSKRRINGCWTPIEQGYTMSIFDLHSEVLADYRDFVQAFFTVTDQRAREFVETALVQERRLRKKGSALSSFVASIQSYPP